MNDSVFRLHSGHNCLTLHLLTGYGTSQSELSPYQTASCVILWYGRTWSHGQVNDSVFRLHSGHNRLTLHLLTGYGTSQSELSPYQTASCVILWYGRTWSHGQVNDSVFRLHSGHNRLTLHLLTGYGTSQSELSPYQTASCVILWYAKTWSHAQVSDCVFRLHSDHNSLTRHLLTEFGTGQSELSPCQTGSMMHRTPAARMSAPHNCRSEFCLVETAVVRKVLSGWDNLQCMAAFVQKIKVSI